jgi:hypothetical protein
MEPLIIVFSAIIFWIVIQLNVQLNRKETLREIENKFLLASMEFIAFKYQALQILKIAYEKAGESDPQFIKDYEKIKLKIEEKFNMMGDKWISELQDKLGYETKYKNWVEATKYIEDIISRKRK